jgi:hypothetical protein
LACSSSGYFPPRRGGDSCYRCQTRHRDLVRTHGRQRRQGASRSTPAAPNDFRSRRRSFNSSAPFVSHRRTRASTTQRCRACSAVVAFERRNALNCRMGFNMRGSKAGKHPLFFVCGVCNSARLKVHDRHGKLVPLHRRQRAAFRPSKHMNDCSEKMSNASM